FVPSPGLNPVPIGPLRPANRPFHRPPFAGSAPSVTVIVPPYPFEPPVGGDPSVGFYEQPPDIGYAPPADVGAVPPPPPPPSVVEYPVGRYELRGDGVGTPFTWVWVPKPPPAPPANPGATASAARPAPPPPPGAPPESSDVFRYTDEHGV